MIRNYSAQSIGDMFYHNLMAGSHTGQIHSVYPTAINMEINGCLYCIVKAKIGNGSYSLMLPALTEDVDLRGCKEGDVVIVDGGVVRCNEIEVDFTEAEVWESKWDEMAHPERLFRMLPQVKALVAREGNIKGLGWLLMAEEEQALDERPMDYAQTILLEQAVPMITAIRRSLTSDSAHFWQSVLGIVGLGPGKTPAGDDFLTGLILMFRYLEWAGLFRLPGVNMQILTTEIKGRTNRLSATGLILAVENRPFELMKDVIENMSSGQKIQTILSVLRLIDRGGSSGTDILTGILFALEMYQEIFYIYQRQYI